MIHFVLASFAPLREIKVFLRVHQSLNRNFLSGRAL